MKKIFVIIGLAAGTLLMSCSASVKTPVAKAGVKVGSIQQVHPVDEYQDKILVG
jgi:hypothetical protein